MAHNILARPIPEEERLLGPHELTRLRRRGISPLPRVVTVKRTGQSDQHGILSGELKFRKRGSVPSSILVSVMEPR